MAEINYSIIIPHYNIPHLLERCLASIPARDDIQVIVVDDHSSLEYLNQIKEIEHKFPQAMFVYSPENRGGGGARNIGMRHATGNYLLFADADDFFLDTFNGVLDRCKDSAQDIIYFRHETVFSDTGEIYSDDYTRWQDEIFENCFKKQDFSGIISCIVTPWAKFFRRDAILKNSITFDELSRSNDVYFVVKAGCLAKSRAMVNEKVYCYTIRKESTTSISKENPDSWVLRLDVSFKAQVLLKQCGISVVPMPLTYGLHRAYKSNKKLYIKYLKRYPEVYKSLWDALFQVRCYERGYVAKIRVYLRSLWWLCVM